MNSNAPLTGSHLRTYETIFRHPISHNLGWHDVHALFRHLGRVEEEANGNFRVTRNGQSMVLHPPRTKEVAETEELMALRRFLERSEPPAPAPNEKSAPAAHWLLVINHCEARIFRPELSGSAPERIVPHEPEVDIGPGARAKDSARRREKTDPSGFFGPIAKALDAARRILVFGGGTGKASEMEQFVAWLKAHRPELAQRIVGTLVVDEHHLSDAQLLAKAREFYALHRTA